MWYESSPFKCALCTSTSAMHQRQSREYVVYVENTYVHCTPHASILRYSSLLVRLLIPQYFAIPQTPPASILRYSSLLVRLLIPQYFAIPQSSYASCLSTSLLLIPRTPPLSSVLRYASVLVRLMPQYFAAPGSPQYFTLNWPNRGRGTHT